MLCCLLITLSAWGQQTEIETTIAEIGLGSGWACDPRYRLFFSGSSQKAFLQTVSQDCDFRGTFFDKESLLEDLRKLQRWGETAKTAGVTVKKEYVGPTSGAKWHFYSYEEGFSHVYLQSVSEGTPISNSKIGNLIDLVEANYDKRKAEHFSFEDPFK